MPKEIAAFGEVMMRLEVPGHDSLTQGHTLRYSFSGTGVNVLSALHRYGHRGQLVTRLPDNPLGDAAAAHLRQLGISADRIVREGNEIGMYFLEHGFGARPNRVTYSNRSASSFNTAPPGAFPFEAVAVQADAVHFCGITLAMNDQVREHMTAFARLAKKHGATVVFDCNYRPALWGEDGYAKARGHYEDMLRLADIVMMNERDAIHLLGLQPTTTEREDQLRELIPEAANRYGIRAVAGTHRDVHAANSHSLRGYLYKDGEFAFSERLTFPVLDRIGAGDAFASGILHGELSGHAPEHTVRFAAAAAILAHTVPGDTPTASERDVLQAMHAPGARDIVR